MFWAPVITLFIITCTCNTGQADLTQDSSMSVSVGQKVELICRGSSIAGYFLSWYQQKPGSAPRLLTYDSNRHTGVPDRFSGSKDSSAKTGKLTISGVQAEDDADYYCGTWDSSLSSYIFGPGTKLAVKTSSPKAPVVSLLPPSADELATKHMVTLSCLAHGFFPRTATVTWKGDTTELSKGVQNSEVKADGASDYKMSSYLTLSAADWEKYNAFSCLVSHESKTITQSITKSECLQS